MPEQRVQGTIRLADMPEGCVLEAAQAIRGLEIEDTASLIIWASQLIRARDAFLTTRRR